MNIDFVEHIEVYLELMHPNKFDLDMNNQPDILVHNMFD
jgi:hypothetical protein